MVNNELYNKTFELFRKAIPDNFKEFFISHPILTDVELLALDSAISSRGYCVKDRSDHTTTIVPLNGPYGIIITFGLGMIKDYGGLLKLWRDINEIADSGDPNWHWCMGIGNRPTKDVEWAYIVINGKIVARMKVLDTEPGGEKRFDNNQTMVKKAWILLQGPLIRPEKRYYRQGFQGFRYTEFIF